MSIASRLDAIERKIGGTVCTLCGNGGGGPVKITMITDPDPNRPPREPCPACGSVPIVVKLRIGDREIEEAEDVY